MRSCTSNDDAAVGSWNQIIVFPATPSQNIRVREKGGRRLWRYNSTADSSDRHNCVLVFRQDGRSVRVASVDHKFCFDGTTCGGDDPAVTSILGGGDFLNWSVCLEVYSLRNGIAEEVKDEFVGPNMTSSVCEASLRISDS